MDISLNKVQKNIAKEARRFLKKECPIDFIREIVDGEWDFTDELWKKMAEMGWMSIRIPEQYGGMGMEQTDINIILEEMGRALLPGPFFSTVMLAGETIMECGNNEQKEKYLPGIADGKILGTFAIYEPEGGSDPYYINLKAKNTGDKFILDGTKLFVPDADSADFIICAAKTDNGSETSDGITLFIINRETEGVSISLIPAIDTTRKIFAVEFNNVQLNESSILGAYGEGKETMRKILQRAQIGLCAEAIGGAERAMEIATEHAKTRVQFDSPIGAFQAVKHLCSQMFLEVESSRSLLYWAAWAQDHADPKEAAIAASTAKSYCSEAGKKVSSSAIQVLGATGFSWESELHLYLKRAKANEMSLGDPAYHREEIMKIIETSA
ncbi:MAG: acyl-CoA/acyl-ACP dehydrogenase [Desulfobacterales bacterium]|jgi:alkylation response protein AidB-like acyl-CoA dehydrogenase|nr:acyl-CoA/acyl-ACP dehydrogenase [Desulfobacteraceae bacterium]MBT7697067.1 acyl-CoA/acyl-ACP dehydrogenase [Desulfobacterales bacterium]